MELPKFLNLGGQQVKVPEELLKKDVHWLINNANETVEAAWINKSLAHILNAQTLEGEARIAELFRGVQEFDSHFSSFIKYEVLRPRKPGAMSFAQTTSNIPEDCIMISERSWNMLPAFWANVSSVYVQRFPNLGPETTKELQIIVNTKKLSNERLEEDTEALSLDAFYIHPVTLKDCFQGDCDGDLIFINPAQSGLGPRFEYVSLVRAPGTITKKSIETLISKASRTKRNSVAEWLPNYFDDVPIGLATYAILWQFYKELKKFDGPNRLQEAWASIAPWAIGLIEFVMDIRKGDYTKVQITAKMGEINNMMKEIRTAQEAGNWFANTITSSTLNMTGDFMLQFENLQEFIKKITNE